MPLQFDPVLVPFVGGVETKQASQTVLPTKVLDLKNAIFDKPGQLGRRNGFSKDATGLPATGHILSGSPEGIYPYKNSLLAIDDSSLLSGDTATSAWKDLAPALGWEASQVPILANSGSQRNADSAFIGKYACYVWEDSITGVTYQIQDANTQTLIIRSVLRPPSGGYLMFPRVVAMGTDFYLFAVALSTGTADLVYYVIDTTNPTAEMEAVVMASSMGQQATPGTITADHFGLGTGEVTVVTAATSALDVNIQIAGTGATFDLSVNGVSSATGVAFEAGIAVDLGAIDGALTGCSATFNGSFVPADEYRFLTPGVLYPYDVTASATDVFATWASATVPKIARLGAAWVQIPVDTYAGTSGNITNCFALFRDLTNNVYVAWSDRTGSKIYCSVYNSTLSLITGASTRGPLNVVSSSNIVGFASTPTSYVVAYTVSNTTNHQLDHTVVTRIRTGPFPILTDTLYGCSVASRMSSQGYFIGLHDSKLQPTYFLIGYFNFRISARLLPGLAGHVEDQMVPTSLHMNASQEFEWAAVYQNRTQSVSGTLTTTTGITKLKLSPTINAPRQAAPLANTFHLAGGNLLMFDGNSAVEHGFFYYPEEVKGQAPSDNPAPLSAPTNVTAMIHSPVIWGYNTAGLKQYKVTAKNTYGETLPSTIGQVNADATNFSVLVSWNAVQGAEAYCVYRNTAGVYRFLAEIPALTGATTQQFIDDGKYVAGAAAPTSNTTGDTVVLPIDHPTTVNSPIESYGIPDPSFVATAHPIPFPTAPTVTRISGGESSVPFPSYYGFVVVATNSDGLGNDSISSQWAICTAGLDSSAPVGAKYIQLHHVDDVIQVSWTPVPWSTGTTTYKVYGGRLRCADAGFGTPVLDDNGNPTPDHYVPFGEPGNTSAPPPWVGVNSESGSVGSFDVTTGVVTLHDDGAYYTASMIGKVITIAGATNAGNNGTFTVSDVLDYETLVYPNAAGVTEVPTNAVWSLLYHGFGLLESGITGNQSSALRVSTVLNNAQIPTNDPDASGDLPGGLYEYWLTAVTTAGETYPIASAQVALSVTGGSGRVVLTWAKLSQAVGYNVYRGTPEGGFLTAGFVSSFYNADVPIGMVTWTDDGHTAVTTAIAPAADRAPALVEHSKVAQGALQTGNYGYIVSSLTQFGETTGTQEVTSTTAHNGVGWLVSWTAVKGAAGYAIYGRSSGKEIFLTNVTRGTTLKWFDDGTLQGESTHQPSADNNTDLTDHSYQYACCYEWTDNMGQIHRSAPSVPIIQGRIGVIDQGNPTTVEVPTLTLTMKEYVEIGIYRTTVNGTVFYRVGSVPNNTDADTVYFTDYLSDGEIIGNEQLYTNGNVLENMEPGACLYPTLHQSRMFVVDALDRRAIWYSKQVIEGQPVEFSDFMKIITEEQGGDVTGIASMDSHLIVFKKNQISISNSLGLDNLGNGDNYSDLSKIPGDTGCVDPLSIVSTNQGVFFRSERGIYMLDRSLQLRYVGAGVEKYLSYTLGAKMSETIGVSGGATSIVADGNLTNLIPPSGGLLLVDDTNGAHHIVQYTSFDYDAEQEVTTVNVLGAVPAEFENTSSLYPFKWVGSTKSVISSAVALPDVHQVRFTILGLPIILVYDWLVDQWSTFTPPFPIQNACLYNGKYTFLDQNKNVFQETPSIYVDVGAATSWVSQGLTSAWVKLSGLTNFQRCRLIHLLGTRGVADFNIAVQIQSNYKTQNMPVVDIDTSDWAAVVMESNPLQARIQPTGEVQKSEAIQVIIADYGVPSTPADRGMTLTGMTLEIGQKRGSFKHGQNY